jgi:tetratricopeptide (TPR) repeat protein
MKLFRLSMAAALLALALLSPAWAQVEQPVPTSPPDPATIVAIPPELEALVRERVIRTTNSHERRLEKLVDVLFGPQGLALEYDGSRTRTISEAFTDRKANCLSFSLMFVALARRAGIDAHVQETDHVLAWQGDGVLYGNGHVNVAVKVGRARKTVDIDRSVVSIRGTQRAISDERALAHFYNNRGAELMGQGQLPAAGLHMAMAIRMEPEFVGAWSNLGVLHMREGSLQQAERAYLAALERNKKHAPALSNLVNLYRQAGDDRRRAEFERRLYEVQRRDPFHQIILALSYEKGHNYAAAIEHFRRAIRLKARDHFVYYGLARSYAHLGDTKRAADALVRARDAAGDQGDMYQAKLERLQRRHASLMH